MRCKKCNKLYDDSFKFCPHCGASAAVRRRSTKRVNGTGTVYKRADLRLNPWIAVTPSKQDSYGDIVRQIIGHYPTAQAARDALEDYRRNPTSKLNITVEQIYAEWADIRYRGISKSTKDNYTGAWLKLRDIYNIKFKELRTAQMQSIINQLADSYSSSALQKVKLLLGQLYQYAMQNDIINKNYAEFIVLPKAVSVVKDCFTDTHIQKIKNAAQAGIRYADLILIMCYTGHRINEFLSLTRFNVITEGDMMFFAGGNKTAAGKNKTVPISPIIADYVQKWIEKSGEVIFCNESGKRWNTQKFREKVWYPTLEALELPRLTPHANGGHLAHALRRQA